MTLITRAALMIGLLLCGSAYPQDMLVGEVSNVIDGDTFDLTVESSGQRERIRVWGIDAPESSQAYGEEATEALRRALSVDQVEVEVVDEDQHGRSVGKVTVNGASVNYWLVEAGHAWVYKRFNDDPRYMAAQRDAQNHQWGLWALPASQRMRPSDYRSR